MTAESADQLWRQAQHYMSIGDTDSAQLALHKLLEMEPAHAAAHMTLGHVAWSSGSVRGCAHHTLQVAQNLPVEASAILAVAAALLRVGETVAARACLQHPNLARSQDGQLVAYHAGLCRQFGDDFQALALLDRAHALGIDGAEFRFMRGMESLICGRLPEGEADLNASLRMDPSASAASIELARLRKQTPENNRLADFEERLHRVPLGTEDHAALEFARYKTLEDLGRFDEAWQALQRANEVMRALHPWDSGQTERQIETLLRLRAPECRDTIRASAEEPQPIFIFGLPRSGTTLLDRMLGSHSQVTSAGELEDFGLQLCWASDQPGLMQAGMLERLSTLDYSELGARYLSQTRWRAGGARFFIDKQPWNHMVAGLIHRALPQARLLHVTRGPMDVCFSNFRALLGARYAYSFDLAKLGQHFLHYRRLQAHWQEMMPGAMLDVAYSDLVHHTERTMRKVVAFCQLEWEPACMDGSRNATAIGTLSAAQARAPIHEQAFEQWRPYRLELAPLAEILLGAGIAGA